MRSGGQTTVIQRILERRAEKPPQIQEDTSATIAVMLRVLPPPRALLVFENEAHPRLNSRISSPRICSSSRSMSDEFEAVRAVH